jgi:hypothetical protein
MTVTSTPASNHVGTHAGTHENPWAGQGAVLLDIGGDVGALVVHMPECLVGTEVEICPADEDHRAEQRAHVAVLARAVGSRTRPTAVFAALPAGRYDLYRKPDGATELVAEVVGGAVRELVWPG